MRDDINSVSHALIKIADNEVYHYGHNIVSDFVDFMLWRCTDGPTGLTVKFNDKQMTTLIKMMECTTQAEPFEDIFGALYEHMASKSKASATGQFFTPEHVCQLMSMLVIQTKTDDIVYCSEPCVGSGRNVLSASKVHRELGNRFLWQCIDLDPICVKMAVVNSYLNSIPGIFFYGDTLRAEMYYCYTIDLYLVDGYWVPYLQYHAGDSEKFIRLREQHFPTMVATPKPTAALTLFDTDLTDYVEVRKKTEAKAQKTAKGDDTAQLSLF